MPNSASSSSSIWSRRSGSGSDHLQRRHDVLLDRQAAEHAGLLRQVADAEAGAAVHRQGGDVGAVQRDAAGVGSHQADDHVEGGGLAGAVRPQQPDRLAAAERDRDVPHHRPLLVGLADAACDQAAAAGQHPEGGARRGCRCPDGWRGRLSLAGWLIGRLPRRAPNRRADEVSPWLVVSFGTTSPARARPSRTAGGRCRSSGSPRPPAPFNWFWPRVMRTLPSQPRDAGVRHVDAAFAGHGVDGGADRDMAERLDLLQLAGRRERRRAGRMVLAAGFAGGLPRPGGWRPAGARYRPPAYRPPPGGHHA